MSAGLCLAEITAVKNKARGREDGLVGKVHAMQSSLIPSMNVSKRGGGVSCTCTSHAMMIETRDK